MLETVDKIQIDPPNLRLAVSSTLESAGARSCIFLLHPFNMSGTSLTLTKTKSAVSDLNLKAQRSDSIMSVDNNVAGEDTNQNYIEKPEEKNQNEKNKNEYFNEKPTSYILLPSDEKTELSPTVQKPVLIPVGKEPEKFKRRRESSAKQKSFISKNIIASNRKVNHSPQRGPELHASEIIWKQGGSKVYVTGTFTGWTKMIKMKKTSVSEFSIKLNLPVGTHKFRFVVDNDLRFSDYLPTATDSRGNLVNYVEVLPEKTSHAKINAEEPTPKDKTSLEFQGKQKRFLRLVLEEDDMGDGYSRFHETSMLINQKGNATKREYTLDIPAIFTDPVAMERYYLTLEHQNKLNGGTNCHYLAPPVLPPHMEQVILNSQRQSSLEGGYNKEIDSGGSLPIPNHVVLNHLATTSIRHNVLAVTTTVRYTKKYLTQVLYSPA